jgi:BarA-like signal transduction histidine kinase
MSGKRQLNVYKHDKWNQMNILVHGKRIVVSEISSVYGEVTYDFMSKAEVQAWARQRFANEPKEEYERILAVFSRI